MLELLNNGLWYQLANGKESWIFILVTSSFVILSALAGYLLGSINSAIIVSRTLYGDDIRNHGSGNAGLTNMLRTYGKGAAGLTLLGDFLKTAISVLIGGILGGFGYVGFISIGGISQGTFPLAYIAGFCSIIGHIYPIFYKFKGGKGVLCTAVMALILNPLEFLMLFALFALIVATSKFVSLGSVSAAVLYPVAVYGHISVILRDVPKTERPATGFLMLIAVVIAIMVVYMHRENLKRISEGTERKLSIGGKKKKNGEDAQGK